MKSLLAACLFVCPPVFGADWILVEDNDKYSIHVDKKSISRSAQYKKAWSLVDFVQAKKMEKHPFKDFYSAKNLTYYDCAQKQYAVIQVLLYSGRTGTGETIDSVKLQLKPTLFEEVAPETIGEAMLNLVCK